MDNDGTGRRDPVSSGEADGSRKKRLRRRVLRWALAGLAVLLVPLLTAETALRVNDTGTPRPGTTTRGQDALWLGHA